MQKSIGTSFAQHVKYCDLVTFLPQTNNLTYRHHVSLCCSNWQSRKLWASSANACHSEYWWFWYRFAVLYLTFRRNSDVQMHRSMGRFLNSRSRGQLIQDGVQSTTIFSKFDFSSEHCCCHFTVVLQKLFFNISIFLFCGNTDDMLLFPFNPKSLQMGAYSQLLLQLLWIIEQRIFFKHYDMTFPILSLLLFPCRLKQSCRTNWSKSTFLYHCGYPG